MQHLLLLQHPHILRYI